jgi:RNA-dependent RNA polymerase
MVLGQAVNLKKKARIKMKKSCVLIGVIDERGLLEDGEVFVQIQRQSYEKDEEEEESANNDVLEILLGTNFPLELISGNVIITKNPCSHPGDIRVLNSIGKDHPHYEEFEHYFNVVIFSSKGERPEQNKMSGGDLDGDVYMVIWEEKLVNNI